MYFSKYHALGNDYLVLDPSVYPGEEPDPDWIRRVCHRNFGLGSDGILFGPIETDNARIPKLRIFNPDGSEAEKSGNGLRIFARHLIDTGKVPRAGFQIETLGGFVSCQQRADGLITVDMGHVSFRSGDIPVTGPDREVISEDIEVEGEMFSFCAATIGNPHCVLLFPEVSERLARRLGPHLENHDFFPKRTNVQFLQIVDRSRIKIEIWERGAGYTLASGSSSSASAAVARKLGAVDEHVQVQMPGGELEISVAEDYSVQMTGPVTRVGEMNFDPEAVGFQVV